LTVDDQDFDVEAFWGMLRGRSNWGRWGKDDQLGTLNLITPEKKAAAARLVRSGRTLSLARHLFLSNKQPDNLYPPDHVYSHVGHEESGVSSMIDHFSPVRNHGYLSTHIDALNHFWSESDGMWGGRDPKLETASEPVKWGDIAAWSQGILTRGVLVDIPRFRGVECVTVDAPVHGSELAEALDSQNISLAPGDVFAIYCGREAWVRSAPEPYFHKGVAGGLPGLHPSCLEFIRDQDVAAVFWDMFDATNAYGLFPAVHYGIWAFGLALIDHCLLEPLAKACVEESRYEFMAVCAPLPITGGTGSLVNPLAVF
jgi:kynurenine formamidase